MKEWFDVESLLLAVILFCLTVGFICGFMIAKYG
jgi:uncharacterized protein YneF (UPF0154 family)